MIHHNLNEGNVALHTHRHIHWSAIFIGALVGVGLGFLLNLYGVAIGLSAYSSTPNGAQAIAIGGFIGMVVGAIAAMLGAGYVTGFLARHNDTCDQHHLGLIYGFATWCVALVISALLVMPVNHYVAAYTSNLTKSSVNSSGDSRDSRDNALSKVTRSSTDNNAKPIPANSEAAENLAWSAWLVFLLFFVGAIAACIGASWAIGCHRKEHDHPAA